MQSLIYRKLKSSHLVPGKYVTAHYRAEYGREVARHPTLQKPTFLRKVAHNAIRCASKLQPGAPIYFASDNAFAKETIKQWALDVGYPIIQFEREEDVVLNLDDMGNDTISYSPSDYYR